MPFHVPMNCPWECHQIGGPWISENPKCPFHGINRLPELEDGGYDIDSELGEELCREQKEKSGETSQVKEIE